MKTAVVCQSFLGSTKKYALWLSEKVQADFFFMKEINKKELRKYDKIVVMSGTYAGRMPLNKFLKNNWDQIKNKKVIAVAVGAAPADDKRSKDSYELIPDEIRSKIRYFKLPGRFFTLVSAPIVPENLDPIIKELKK